MSYWNLIEAKALPSLHLWVRFENGLEGVLHLDESQTSSGLIHLNDPEYFARVTISNGVATWPDGEELAPDHIYEKVRKSRMPS